MCKNDERIVRMIFYENEFRVNVVCIIPMIKMKKNLSLKRLI